MARTARMHLKVGGGGSRYGLEVAKVNMCTGGGGRRSRPEVVQLGGSASGQGQYGGSRCFKQQGRWHEPGVMGQL